MVYLDILLQVGRESMILLVLQRYTEQAKNLFSKNEQETSSRLLNTDYEVLPNWTFITQLSGSSHLITISCLAAIYFGSFLPRLLLCDLDLH